MRLFQKHCIYRGLDNEEVPDDVTHIIVDASVTAIKAMTFYRCWRLVSVVMGDNVEIIENGAFIGCRSLKIVCLSKTLKCIGEKAFGNCISIENLIIPSSVKEIADFAFFSCTSLKLLVLSSDQIEVNNVGRCAFWESGMAGISRDNGMGYQIDRHGNITNTSSHRVNEWMIQHMDSSPFHKLCCRSDISAQKINEYLSNHSTCRRSRNAIVTGLDEIYQLTPLHMLAMNPFAPAEAVAGTIIHDNMDAVITADNHEMTPLDYATQYNVPGLLRLVEALCLHRQFTTSIRSGSGKITSLANGQGQRERVRKRGIAEVT